jgi:hypothetical protein
MDVTMIKGNPIGKMAEFLAQLSNALNYDSMFGERYFIEEVLADKEVTKGVNLIATYCAMDMAYTYGVCEHCDHWDDRNKASSQWCFDHREPFKRYYEQRMGEEFPFKPDEHREGRCFLDDVKRSKLPDGAYEGVEQWHLNVHHSIQQRMMKVFAKILARSRVKGFTDTDIYFPDF